MIDLDALDELVLRWPLEPMPAGLREDLRAALAELRASRRVMETSRGDVRWLMQAVLDRVEWTAPDGCPEHLCEFTTNPEKGACSFHEEWFGIADRHGLLEWLDPELEAPK